MFSYNVFLDFWTLEYGDSLSWNVSTESMLHNIPEERRSQLEGCHRSICIMHKTWWKSRKCKINLGSVSSPLCVWNLENCM